MNANRYCFLWKSLVNRHLTPLPIQPNQRARVPRTPRLPTTIAQLYNHLSYHFHHALRVHRQEYQNQLSTLALPLCLAHIQKGIYCERTIEKDGVCWDWTRGRSSEHKDRWEKETFYKHEAIVMNLAIGRILYGLESLDIYVYIHRIFVHGKEAYCVLFSFRHLLLRGDGGETRARRHWGIGTHHRLILNGTNTAKWSIIFYSHHYTRIHGVLVEKEK